MQRGLLRLGTLGGAATFAGEATQYLLRTDAGFHQPEYFPSMDACWTALRSAAVDAIVLGVERTGQPHHGDPVLDHRLFVARSFDLPLQCNLYVRRGVDASAVRRIVGHGSIKQCTTYLDAEFPGVPREMLGENSIAAARAVVSADETWAVVGSSSLAATVKGLQVVAQGIDDGAMCRWWVVTSQAMFAEEPTHVIAGGEFGPAGELGAFVDAMSRVGLALRSAAAFPALSGVGNYRYLLDFAGVTRRDIVEGITHNAGVRLIGAI